MFCGGKCPTNLFFFPPKKTRQHQQHCFTVTSAACAIKVPPGVFWWVKQLCKGDTVPPRVHVQAPVGIWNAGNSPHWPPEAARSCLFL